jgi:hypothetical protein
MIDGLLARYSINEQVAERESTGEGPNWESFCVYDPKDPSEPGVIFEGATKLPDNSQDAVWEGLQHWCALLWEIRRTLTGASWRVHVDDHDIIWDDDRHEFDPTQ